ncbi:DNA cytosine methyltransferase [Mycobacterium novum]
MKRRDESTPGERRRQAPQSQKSPSRSLLTLNQIGLNEWVPDGPHPLRPAAQVLDMFCGCGGMSLGFAAAGQLDGTFQVVGGVDIDPASLATFHVNFNVPALQRDLREVAAYRGGVRRLVSELPDFDGNRPLVLIGCAPCQGFSAHAKKRWASLADDRNDLIHSFARIAAELSPDCVVMENVPELITGRYSEHFENFRTVMDGAGYTVRWGIYNAAQFGVPQARMRSIAIAMPRDDFRMPQSLLEPSQYRTVRDAIGELPAVAPGYTHPADSMHRSAGHRDSTLEVIRAVPRDGGSRPRGVGPACLDKVKGFSDVYGRLYWDRPAITLTHYARNPASGRYTHPEQDRGLTMREAARLQSFPDGFRFEGKFDDVFRQIGEAVPPLLSIAVARTVAANLAGQTEISMPDCRKSSNNDRSARAQ